MWRVGHVFASRQVLGDRHLLEPPLGCRGAHASYSSLETSLPEEPLGTHDCGELVARRYEVVSERGQQRGLDDAESRLLEHWTQGCPGFSADGCPFLFADLLRCAGADRLLPPMGQCSRSVVPLEMQDTPRWGHVEGPVEVLTGACPTNGGYEAVVDPAGEFQNTAGVPGVKPSPVRKKIGDGCLGVGPWLGSMPAINPGLLDGMGADFSTH